MRSRGRYVSAALTLILAWIAAGRPMSPCKPIADYGEWSDVCRQPLLWLGCPDPATSLFEAMEADPDREQLGRLLQAWFGAFGSTPKKVREAVQSAQISRDTQGDLWDVCEDIAGERGEINNRRLGNWIRRHLGRIVDGLRFAREGGKHLAEKWRVQSVSSVSSLSFAPDKKNGSNHEVEQFAPVRLDIPAGSRSHGGDELEF